MGVNRGAVSCTDSTPVEEAAEGIRLARAMRAVGSGTIMVTGGGFADHPIPALATISLGKAALRSAATMLGADLEPDGIHVATLTIAGQIVAGIAFDPENVAKALLGGRPFRGSLAGGVSLTGK